MPATYQYNDHRIMGIGIPIIKLRRSRDRLSFIMAMPIPLDCDPYIGTSNIMFERAMLGKYTLCLLPLEFVTNLCVDVYIL